MHANLQVKIGRACAADAIRVHPVLIRAEAFFWHFHRFQALALGRRALCRP
jgi:hypothetical protein